MEGTETNIYGMLRVQQVLKYCLSDKVDGEDVSKGPDIENLMYKTSK